MGRRKQARTSTEAGMAEEPMTGDRRTLGSRVSALEVQMRAK